MKNAMTYELWYWPGLPGRGYFAGGRRLAFDADCLFRDYPELDAA